MKPLQRKLLAQGSGRITLGGVVRRWVPAITLTHQVRHATWACVLSLPVVSCSSSRLPFPTIV